MAERVSTGLAAADSGEAGPREPGVAWKVIRQVLLNTGGIFTLIGYGAFFYFVDKPILGVARAAIPAIRATNLGTGTAVGLGMLALAVAVSQWMSASGAQLERDIRRRIDAARETHNCVKVYRHVVATVRNANVAGLRPPETAEFLASNRWAIETMGNSSFRSADILAKAAVDLGIELARTAGRELTADGQASWRSAITNTYKAIGELQTALEAYLTITDRMIAQWLFWYKP